jgi:hypothetical protein
VGPKATPVIFRDAAPAEPAAHVLGEGPRSRVEEILRRAVDQSNPVITAQFSYVRSAVGAEGPFSLQDLIPFSIAAVEEYISLLPMTSGDAGEPSRMVVMQKRRRETHAIPAFRMRRAMCRMPIRSLSTSTSSARIRGAQ